MDKPPVHSPAGNALDKPRVLSPAEMPKDRPQSILSTESSSKDKRLPKSKPTRASDTNKASRRMLMRGRKETPFLPRSLKIVMSELACRMERVEAIRTNASAYSLAKVLKTIPHCGFQSHICMGHEILDPGVE